jgi:ribonuclease Z
MQLTISGYSTALFSTWYFVEELGVLFDAGDGVIANLLQKSRKIKHVFISHADRDHLTGLIQLNQLNARAGFPKMYYPKDARSIRTLEAFSKEFDDQVESTEWIPLTEGQEIEIKKDIIVTPIKNHHVASPDSILKSTGYLVQNRKYKLKQQYLHLSQKEIIALRNDLGEKNLTEEVRVNVLGYSGDTPVENFSVWNNTETLIHEATFLNKKEISDNDTRRNKHSVLEDVLIAASSANIKNLIIGHISSRYKAEEIDECIQYNCQKYNISFPVFRLLPGEYIHNITSSTQTNNRAFLKVTK